MVKYVYKRTSKEEKAFRHEVEKMEDVRLPFASRDAQRISYSISPMHIMVLKRTLNKMIKTQEVELLNRLV